MSRFKILAGIVAACLWMPQCIAASVEFKLYLGPLAQGPGTFRLTATASQGDNFGLAQYSVPLVDGLVGVPGVLSVDHNSLGVASVINTNGDEGPAGFTRGRSADLATPQDFYVATGEQDLITPTPHIIRRFAQGSGSLTGLGLSPAAGEGDDWMPELTLATGTYLPGAGLQFAVTAATYARVFTSANGTATAVPQIRNVVVIPEPARLALALSGVICWGLASRLTGQPGW